MEYCGQTVLGIGKLSMSSIIDNVLIINKRQLLRWCLISAFDILTEICLVAGSLMICWDMHAPVPKRIGVVTMFAYRLL